MVKSMRSDAVTCPHGIKPKRNCKECQRIWRKNWAEKNRERDKELKRNYSHKHNKELVEKLNEYRQQNPQKFFVHKLMNNNPDKYPLASECELCPDNDKLTEDLERHHPDYNYPEIYVTVCRFCHRELEG